jgi:hypothetical protein
MRTAAFATACAAIVSALAAAVLLRGPGPDPVRASSHREAPLIADDPTADNTDLYAFRSPDKPDTVTIISNVLPGEDPGAGPNYYRFSSAARYNIHIDRNGDAFPEISYHFQFRNRPGQFFLGNTVQDYTLTRVTTGRGAEVVARGTTAPNNIGARTTPNYRALVRKAVLPMKGGGQVFAGQREDAFFADIGAIFDLLALRKGTGNAGGGKDFFAGYAVHALALQIPISQLDDSDHTIGVWTTVERRRTGVRGRATGPWVQVSRLGNPLVNEVVIPTELKDAWNADTVRDEAKYVRFYRTPILAAVINKLYPNVIDAPERNRDDLVAVLLTGVPGLNNTGAKQADVLRLNLSIAPAGPVGTGKRLGVLAGDNAGWPNGRRLEDDVVDIAERAVAGALTKNPKAGLIGDGVDANDVRHLTTFPYEADPSSGFANSKGRQKR